MGTHLDSDHALPAVSASASASTDAAPSTEANEGAQSRLPTALQTPEGSAASSTPRRVLTPEQRALICAHSAANPKMTQHALAAWAKQTFQLPVEPSQSMISSTLRRSRDSSGEALCKPRKKPRVKHPKLDDELLKWVLSCELHEIKISGEQVKQRGEVLCEKYKIPVAARPSFSNGWLASFNRRHGLKRFKRDPARLATLADDTGAARNDSDESGDDDDSEDDGGNDEDEDETSGQTDEFGNSVLGGDPRDDGESIAELESEYRMLLEREQNDDYDENDAEWERSSIDYECEDYYECEDEAGIAREESSTFSETALDHKRRWRRNRIEELEEQIRVMRSYRRPRPMAAKRTQPTASGSGRASKKAKSSAAPALAQWNEITADELLASKREADLRIEGLQYDNELKRLRVVEESMLARKRLKDAGVADDVIDRLMPLPLHQRETVYPL